MHYTVRDLMAVNSCWGLSGQLPAPGGLPLRLHSLCLRGIRARHSPTARSTCVSGQRVRAIGVGEMNAHELRQSAATILLNQVGKDLREIQELLRHKNIRTTVRYTHVGYEQTRQTAKAQSALE